MICCNIEVALITVQYLVTGKGESTVSIAISRDFQKNTCNTFSFKQLYATQSSALYRSSCSCPWWASHSWFVWQGNLGAPSQSHKEASADSSPVTGDHVWWLIMFFCLDLFMLLYNKYFIMMPGMLMWIRISCICPCATWIISAVFFLAFAQWFVCLNTLVCTCL